MSYSFGVRAATKSLLKLAVAAKLAEVVAQQPIHARDQTQVQAAADAFIDQVTDDDTKDVVASVSGYLSGQWEGTDVALISTASVSVSAGHATREKAAA